MDQNATAPVESLSFHLSSDERTAIRRSFYKRALWMPPIDYAMAILWAGIFIAHLPAFDHGPFGVPLLIVSGFMVAMYVPVGIYAARRIRPIAAQGKLTMSNDGIAGTIDGRPVSIDWGEVGSATNLDNAILLMPRRLRGSAIALPKSSIGDVTELWTFLEDRLVSKRGLVRTSAPVKHIVNTAKRTT